jgi:hypothetical protein
MSTALRYLVTAQGLKKSVSFEEIKMYTNFFWTIVVSLGPSKMENRKGKYHVHEDTYFLELYPCQSDSHNGAADNAGYGSDCWVRLEKTVVQTTCRLAVREAEPIRLRTGNPRICARNFLMASN